MSSFSVSASHIVRMQFEYQGAVSDVDIELFPSAAPLTVANFIDYVQNNRYDGTFIYRSVPGFVLQTGGYTFRPLDPVNDPLRPVSEGTGLELVPEGSLSPVVNEFNLSNTRGTIAMAKLPGQPDSATNEWFVNLADNSSSLDTQNGGFTVFGEIVDDGMQIMDEISTLPKHLFIKDLLGSAFSDMPVTGQVFGAIYREDMVMINSMSLINRPVLRASPVMTDFFLDVVGDASSIQASVTLVNSGDDSLTVGSIVSPADSQFSIITDNCSSVTLEPLQSVPTSSCSILLAFEAVSVGDFSTALVIPYTNLAATESYALSYMLAGSGVPDTPVLVADVSSVYFDEVIDGQTAQRQITLQNRGGGDLTLSGYLFSGNSAMNYSTASGCDQGTVLSIGQTCELVVDFAASDVGLQVADLEIQSSANSVSVALSALVVKPAIDVVPSIELAAQAGGASNVVETINNIGSGTLVISNISIVGVDAMLFSQINNCPGVNNSGVPDAPLGEGQSCAFRVDYMPVSDGIYSATLVIESNDPDMPVLSIPITGRTGNPSINVADSFFVGTAQVNGVDAGNRLEIKNDGSAPLQISAISGFSAGNLTETNDCIASPVESGQKCYIDITFASSQVGEWVYPITIESNDPQRPSIQVNLEVAAEYDVDGVAGDEEGSAPNSGDGNNDGMQDGSQNNVVSFYVNGTAVTLAADKSLALKADTIIRNLTKNITVNTEPGESFDLKVGIQSFTISVPGGDAVDVGFILPPDISPQAFYLNDVPENGLNGDWYDFQYDDVTNTGVLINSKVNIDNPASGTMIERHMVIVRFVDGRRGDADLAADGRITVNAGGLVFAKNEPAAGKVSLWFLFIVCLFKCLTHRRFVLVKA